MRRSSFQKLDAENASVDVMLSRKITSQYDSVKVVEDRLAEIVAVAEALPQVVLAVQSAIDANESELAAQEAADLATRYATEDFNVPVVDGKYSAKHWAQVAETAAGTGVIDDLVTNTSRTWSSSKLVNSFEPLDSTIVRDADIGISVQPYNASTVVDSAYVHTDANYTTLEKTKLSGIASGAQVNTVNSVAGKTGAVTLVKGDVGLGSVDNTTDLLKPVSTAAQTALNLKANLASPTFTGTVAGITKTMVGLGLVDNTADTSKAVASAGKLTAIKTFTLTGDVTGTVTSDLAAGVSIATVVGNDSHLHAFANLTSKPTTVSGYGITDAYTKVETAAVVAAVINDDAVATTTTYSSSKTQTLYDLQTEAIANLATAQCRITQSSTPALALTTTHNVLPFAIHVDSTDTNIMTVNDAANTITFLKNASFNFLSHVLFSSTTSFSRTVTFELINTSNGAVLVSESALIDIASGTTEGIALNTLITVGRNGIPSAPLTVRIQAYSTNTGHTVQSFNSILASSSSYDVSTEASGINFVPTGGIAASNVQAAVAELDTEKEPRNANIQSHISSTGNPHVVTKTQVGLGSVDNTADSAKIVASAGKLTTARSIALTGDVTGTVNFDGSANASMVTAVGNDSHLHAFANLTSKPTTVSGYGITDAYTKTEVQTVLPKIGLDTTNVTPPEVGQIAWNQNERTIDVGVNGMTLQVGQEQLINVRNNTASLILNKTVLMATGTIGASGRITVAPYNGGDPKYILGIATEDIAAGLDGFVTSFGKVRGVNTSMWADGAVLYVALNGELTPIEPVTGVNLPVAIVVHSHATVGTLFVRITPIDVGSYEPRDVGIQAHIASLSNPHGVTKAQLLLDNVDNTADIDKAVFSAIKWSTPISVNIGGTSKSVDGTASVTWSVADIGAQPVDGDLTAIGALVGTSGLLKKTAVNTWALDTTVYAIGSDMTTALANKLSQSNGVIDLGNITEVVS